MPVVREPEILPVMAGTAGHVDHGKTALVTLLTGCNTDTLLEEKNRGLTIDLGFAPCLVSGNRMIGIVDVPGHIDFIKNMVAGAASLDILILVIAADDSVMPQTVEHLKIVKLLRTPIVMAVVTKIDLVEPDMAMLVCEEVHDFLTASGYPDAPVVPMSNITLKGISEVRRVLSACVDTAAARRQESAVSQQAFRMNVERVFSVKGHGTVVTGIPVSGSLETGETVVLMPGERKCKLRGVQNYKQISGKILPNACNAVNISDVSAETVHRGETLTAPEMYKLSDTPTLYFQNVSMIPLTDGMQVRFHSGTSGVNASTMVSGGRDIKPGHTGFLKMKLDESIVLCAGDHFIIRRHSPSETLGGGRVLAVRNSVYKKSDASSLIHLQQAYHALENQNQVMLSEILGTGAPIFEGKKVAATVGFPPDFATKMLSALTISGNLVSLGNDFYAAVALIQPLTDSIIVKLRRFHAEKPYAAGIDPLTLAQDAGLSADCARSWTAFLEGHPSKAFKMRHGKLSLSEFKPQISARQLKQKESLLHYLKTCGAKIPAYGNMESEMEMSSQELKFILKVLIETEEAVQVGNHIFEYELYEKLRSAIMTLFQSTPSIGVNEARDVCGLSRNMTVSFLEHLDAKGITRRIGDMRVRASEPIPERT